MGSTMAEAHPLMVKQWHNLCDLPMRWNCDKSRFAF